MNIWKISEFFLKYLIHKYQFSLLCSELKEYIVIKVDIMYLLCISLTLTINLNILAI